MALDQLQRVEGQIELKCDADKFYDVWCRKPYLVSQICPVKIPKVELHHQGDWHEVGAFITWNYVFKEVGERASVKVRVEELDEEKRSVRYSYHDGHILRNYYSTFRSKMQATPKTDGCTLKWSFEYVKKSVDAPEPNMYIDYLLGTAKDIDVGICSN